MRLAIAAALCIVTAAPAMAQSQDRAQDIAHALDNPMVQEGVAVAASALAGIVLDTRVGPIAHYADPSIRETDTLRDIQRRRDPGFEKRLHDDTRRAVAIAGKVADDALAMRASLDETATRLRAALAPLRQVLGNR